jgi:hypothetical protein
LFIKPPVFAASAAAASRAVYFAVICSIYASVMDFALQKYKNIKKIEKFCL